MSHAIPLFPRPRFAQRRPGLCHAPAALSVAPKWEAALHADLAPLAPAAIRIIHDPALPAQGYRLSIDTAGVELRAADVDAARYGLRALRQVRDADGAWPCMVVQDAPATLHRGVQIDLGRVTERPDTVQRLLDVYASLNINRLQFYLENALVFPSHPKLARHRAWTIEQAMTVVQAAERYGIGVIPAIQSLGHCSWVGSNPDYREFDEGFDSGQFTGVLCPAHEGVHQMLRDMIRDVAPLATAGIIHLGMDESFSIGMCRRCSALKQQIGEGGIFVQHANRVAAYAREVGKRPAIWGDMFGFYPEALPQLDKDVLIFDWYYYDFERYPRIELFRFAEFDSLSLWQKHGLEAWGCPWSVCTVIMPLNEPRQSIDNANSWLRYLRQRGQQGMMSTQWELKPTSIDLCPPIEGAVAAAMWEQPLSDAHDLLTRSCEFLCDRPQLADWLAELGRHRIHGHCARRWLNSPSVEAMVTYADAAQNDADLALAGRLDAMAGEVTQMSRGAKHAEFFAPLPICARWLAYQYRKRSLVNQAALDAVARRYAQAVDLLRPLIEQARTLAGQWQSEWERNRYADDESVLPPRLRQEADWFAAEVAALQSAAGGEAYCGGLDKPVLRVEIRNTHPGVPLVALATSPDGRQFTERGAAWVLEFDNHAARPQSDDELVYAFALPALDDAQHVRITPKGGGAVTLRGVELCHGTRRWRPTQASATGAVDDPSSLVGGQGAVIMGCQDTPSLFKQLERDGAAGRIFSHPHGSLLLNFQPR